MTRRPRPPSHQPEAAGESEVSADAPTAPPIGDPPPPRPKTAKEKAKDKEKRCGYHPVCLLGGDETCNVEKDGCAYCTCNKQAPSP